MEVYKLAQSRGAHQGGVVVGEEGGKWKGSDPVEKPQTALGTNLEGAQARGEA